jgi:hypothetical protein
MLIDRKEDAYSLPVYAAKVQGGKECAGFDE